MRDFPDLEIGIYLREINAYTIELYYRLPDSDAKSLLCKGRVNIDLEKLAITPFMDEYGQILTEAIFADPEIKDAFTKAQASAQSLGLPLRVRLFIDPDAGKLHNVHWETLQDPLNGSPLTINDTLFSRYLTSPDFRSIRWRSKGDLSALVVIANPSNLSEYNLAAIDFQNELEHARLGFKKIPMMVLPGPGNSQPASLRNIIANLRDHEHDILYLVCHGTIDKQEPWLWLEDNEGKVSRTSGQEFVQQIRALAQRPRLIILASCQSAGNSAGDAMAALGPRLAEIGIPAVIAMQGNISLQTVSEFMPVFFTELDRDGQIDRAMTAARTAVHQRPDAWMPVLFMRLESGRIWYTPGFADPKAFRKWPALLSNIDKGRCTPIIGPGLVEPLLGSQREIAQRWAETYGYPLFPYERESLPQVAQYLAIDQQPIFPRDELEKYLREELQDRYQNELPSELLDETASLDRLIQEIGAKRRQHHPQESHKVLASLPLSIYITADVNNLLETALKEVNKQPRSLISPWNEYVRQTEPVYANPGKAIISPSPEQPLVYHLFGRLSEPESIVLTEDQYFQYLIEVTRFNDRIPSAIRFALTRSALLFLGFRLDDWNFRVLFQSLISREGRQARSDFQHIAVQIEPEEDRILAPENARNYLKEYFEEKDIFLYWGSSEDFVKELDTRLSVAR